MNWIWIALIAHFLYALVYMLDKFILSSPIRSPLSYAFYTGFLGGLIIFIAPFFDFHLVRGTVLLESLLSGAFFTLALICFYRTLQVGEASRSVPFVGALVPIVTLAATYLLGIGGLEGSHITAFIFLVTGSFLIVFGYKNDNFWAAKNIFFLVVSALLFGVSFALTKLVFTQTNFISGLVWVRMGSVVFSILLLSRRPWRHEIFKTTVSASPETAGWFLGSKILGATAVILQNYAIFLGSVVVVNSLQATQYLFLLVLAIFLSWRFPRLFHETLGRAAIAQKILAIAVIGVGLIVLAMPAPIPKNVTLGITFSQKFMQELDMDWRRAYRAMLDDLKVKHIRLIAYWDRIEPKNDEFDFADLDWQIAEARAHGAAVVLAVGRKNPRWPECHEPEWIKRLDESAQNEELIGYVAAVVERYRTEQSITAWQIENEPLFPFGDCPVRSFKTLKSEIAQVRALDVRPVMLTDAGELGLAWPVLIPQSDIFGTTLYRYVHNRLFGDIKYWFVPSAFFRFKAWIAQSIFGKEIVISELQAEPWMSTPLGETSLEDQYRAMSPAIFREIIRYARISGFSHAYLWGAEWWYWLKEKRGDPSMWYVAGEAIQNSNAQNGQ